MTYTQWFQAHADKHRRIVDKLIERNFTPEQIVDYFDFENMIRHESDFCLLYATQTKCHDLPRLNCYWCACPHFRFNDDAPAAPSGITTYSRCSINAPLGGAFQHDQAIHHDCSGCTIPHDRSTILKSFSANWHATMSECDTSSKN